MCWVSYLGRPWVHSSVARAADCRSAGPWFKSGCALLSAGAGQPLSDQLRHRPSVPHRLTWVSNPVTRNRTRDHLIAALIYNQMLYQLSYDRLVLPRPQLMLSPTSSMRSSCQLQGGNTRCAQPPGFRWPNQLEGRRKLWATICAGTFPSLGSTATIFCPLHTRPFHSRHTAPR